MCVHQAVFASDKRVQLGPSLANEEDRCTAAAGRAAPSSSRQPHIRVRCRDPSLVRHHLLLAAGVPNLIQRTEPPSRHLASKWTVSHAVSRAVVARFINEPELPSSEEPSYQACWCWFRWTPKARVLCCAVLRSAAQLCIYISIDIVSSPSRNRFQAHAS